ncbi:MAG: hypothetical protein WCV86_05385 [Patescibacteria group bacterium]|jgi:hypothetical protein
MSIAPTQAGSNDEQSAGNPDDDPGGAPDHELTKLEDVVEIDVRLSGGFIDSHHRMGDTTTIGSYVALITQQFVSSHR